MGTAITTSTLEITGSSSFSPNNASAGTSLIKVGSQTYTAPAGSQNGFWLLILDGNLLPTHRCQFRIRRRVPNECADQQGLRKVLPRPAAAIPQTAATAVSALGAALLQHESPHPGPADHGGPTVCDAGDRFHGGSGSGHQSPWRIPLHSAQARDTQLHLHPGRPRDPAGSQTTPRSSFPSIIEWSPPRPRIAIRGKPESLGACWPVV